MSTGKYPKRISFLQNTFDPLEKWLNEHTSNNWEENLLSREEARTFRQMFGSAVANIQNGIYFSGDKVGYNRLFSCKIDISFQVGNYSIDLEVDGDDGAITTDMHLRSGKNDTKRSLGLPYGWWPFYILKEQKYLILRYQDSNKFLMVKIPSLTIYRSEQYPQGIIHVQ